MANMTQILVVDDEAGIRELLLEILHDEGYQVILAENAAAARAHRGRNAPDLVLLDIWMPDTDGVTLLREWASNGLLTMPVVMMSGHGTIDTAVEATKIGAFDFLEKPIALQKLLSTVARALKKNGNPQRSLGSLEGLGSGALIGNLQKRLEQLAQSRSPLLLTGEEGVGLEICARFLHQPATPWVEPDEFSDLAERPLDMLEQAREGVLFLHDVADLNKMEQKGLGLLLGKLEKHATRLVCATSKALPQMVEAGTFDAALFQTLSGMMLAVPKLHEHSEDVPELARQMLAKCAENGECPPRRFSAAALEYLRNHHWPGNLPQLCNVVKNLALTALAEEITAQETGQVLAQFNPETPAERSVLPLDLPLREARDEFERVYFEHQIKKAGGNMSRVADYAGLERTHLYRKLKQLGIR
ncbi:MAG: sigma-54 dependent transcriptional regulator [Sulfuricellaceae bacterium]